MAKPESFGLKKLDSVHYYVRDLDRSRKFYVDRMDFAEVGQSTPELEQAGKQRSVMFQAGEAKVICSQPMGEGGRASRWLKKHPAGVGTLNFEVEDIDRAFKTLEARGATPIQDIQRFKDDHGTLAMFSIATPFGDCTFRFFERKGFRAQFPGFAAHDKPRGGNNALGVLHFDHVTSNFQTMKPALLWMEHVIGLEKFWDVEFHTSDVNGKVDKGSGLRSIVMVDHASHVKFANNEPMRPLFRASQINIFNEDLRGDGVQHVALEVKDQLAAVREMKKRGVQFMPTPGTYYDMLPKRLETLGITLKEKMEDLRELEILVDGEKKGEYMLQIFLKDAAGLYQDPAAGPFFYEIIQRQGGQGFGAGNFRALFESIEREQQKQGRI
jgi:4-hydroxyphenylpyruvate dioxygenase